MYIFLATGFSVLWGKCAIYICLVTKFSLYCHWLNHIASQVNVQYMVATFFLATDCIVLSGKCTICNICLVATFFLATDCIVLSGKCTICNICLVTTFFIAADCIVLSGIKCTICNICLVAIFFLATDCIVLSGKCAICNICLVAIFTLLQIVLLCHVNLQSVWGGNIFPDYIVLAGTILFDSKSFLATDPIVLSPRCAIVAFPSRITPQKS